LITPPRAIYQFWQVSPFDVAIFFISVIVIVFSSIENGIYTSISITAAILLFRIIKAKGHFLGRVKVHSIIDDHIVGNDSPNFSTTQLYKVANHDIGISRNAFLPLDHGDGSNLQIELQTPHPCIFIYRLSEGFNYANANHYLDYLISTILKTTRITSPNEYLRPGVSYFIFFSLGSETQIAPFSNLLRIVHGTTLAHGKGKVSQQKTLVPRFKPSSSISAP